MDQETDRLRARQQQQRNLLHTISNGSEEFPIGINRVELLRGRNLPDMNLMRLLSNAGRIAAPAEDMKDEDHQADEHGIIKSLT